MSAGLEISGFRVEAGVVESGEFKGQPGEGKPTHLQGRERGRGANQAESKNKIWVGRGGTGEDRGFLADFCRVFWGDAPRLFVKLGGGAAES